MNTLYTLTLALHNLLRWVVVALAIFVLYRSYRGWLQTGHWSKQDKKAGTFFTIALDIQLLVGLILYFLLSPLTQAFFSNLAETMSNNTLRFFGIEHILIMIVAIILSHYTNTIHKRDLTDSQKFKRTAILYTIVVALIVLGIPWTSRPLLPAIG